MFDFDILIIGGGPVGHACITALRNTPLKMGCVEARVLKDTCTDQRTFALSLSSQQHLSQWGIWSSLETHVLPIMGVHVSESSVFGAARFSAKEMDVPALGYAVSAQQVQNVLAKQAKQYAEMICPARLTAIQPMLEGYKIVLECGGVERIYTTRCLVGADGMHSTVRTLLGLQATVRDCHKNALVTQLRVSRPASEIAYQRFTSEGSIALLPTISGYYACIWTIPRETTQTWMQAEAKVFLDHIQKWFGNRLGTFSDLGLRADYPIYTAHCWKEPPAGVVLLGSAAHHVSPVGAQGLNSALRDVAAFALLCSAHHGQDFSSITHDFWEARIKDQRAVASLTDALSICFSWDNCCARVVRSLGFALLSYVPPLKRSYLKRLMLGSADI